VEQNKFDKSFFRFQLNAKNGFWYLIRFVCCGSAKYVYILDQKRPYSFEHIQVIIKHFILSAFQVFCGTEHATTWKYLLWFLIKRTNPDFEATLDLPGFVRFDRKHSTFKLNLKIFLK
jgi:hypothetical protein